MARLLLLIAVLLLALGLSWLLARQVQRFVRFLNQRFALLVLSVGRHGAVAGLWLAMHCIFLFLGKTMFCIAFAFAGYLVLGIVGRAARDRSIRLHEVVAALRAGSGAALVAAAMWSGLRILWLLQDPAAPPAATQLAS
ncbi:hypothetical protein AACH10_23065 [Ideonella sp. DXS22W]|uniref:Metallophosphoesterase n=1 Tax=Pseudaquabacterium inlustre TaxID=2984192 RepID=A0ABU9CMV0_9BURK